MSSSDLKSRFAALPREQRRGWIHFSVASLILLVVAVGFSATVSYLKVALEKYPVSWPTGVTVNEKTFQNTSFPKQLGRFRQLEGEDGDREIKEEVLDALGMGSPLDKLNVSPERRKSNWYLSRNYRDTRTGMLWGLEVTYYTGMIDTVPHVPEVCGAASGARVLGGDNFEMTAPTRMPAGWPETLWSPFPVRAVTLEQTDRDGQTFQSIQYYVLSLNGQPMIRREAVRAKMLNPFVKYVYFAKIQWYPLVRFQTLDINQVNQMAEEFIRAAMPSVLSQLPSPEDIEKLEASD